MPSMSVADQRRLTFLRNITCIANPILSTLGRLCDYDFGAVAAVYNVTVFMLVTATISQNVVWYHSTRNVVWCGSGVGMVCLVFGRRLALSGFIR